MKTIFLLQKPIIGTDDFQPVRAYEDGDLADQECKERNTYNISLGGFVITPLDLVERGDP